MSELDDLTNAHRELSERVTRLGEQMDRDYARINTLSNEAMHWKELADYRAKENDAMWKLLNWYRAQHPTAVEPKL